MVSDPWAIPIVLTIIGGTTIFTLWARYGMSDEQRKQNTNRFKQWIHSDSQLARLYSWFLWACMIGTLLHIIVTIYDH